MQECAMQKSGTSKATHNEREKRKWLKVQTKNSNEDCKWEKNWQQ